MPSNTKIQDYHQVEGNQAVLLLENGSEFWGLPLGKKCGKTFGEVVFNTATTGYQETLTDPSYYNQIVVQTATHIGNTGINFEDNESKKIWVSGYVIKELSPISSSWRSKIDLETFLQKNKIVGIKEVDTRALTLILRENGVMKGGIFAGVSRQKFDKAKALNEVKQQQSMQGQELASKVSIKKPYILEPKTYTTRQTPELSASKTKPKISKQKKLKQKDAPIVVAVDLGIKANSPKILSELGCKVIVVPNTITIKELLKYKPNGVFFSNGPGDPSTATKEVKLLTEILQRKIPFFGICYGNQILGRTLGFNTVKLKFGHRGINQPVQNVETGKVEITSHNHGFAVDMPINKLVVAPNKEFGKVFASFVNLNDNTVEGIKCQDIPAFSVQFHPESAAGTHDSKEIFSEFLQEIAKKQ